MMRLLQLVKIKKLKWGEMSQGEMSRGEMSHGEKRRMGRNVAGRNVAGRNVAGRNVFWGETSHSHFLAVDCKQRTEALPLTVWRMERGFKFLL